MNATIFSQKLIEDFGWYYQQKYITPRDGNACVKLNTDEYLITPSGVRKQAMSAESLLVVNNQGKKLQPNSNNPSIELGADLLALKIKQAQVSVHVHSLNTVALFSLATKKGFLKVLENNFRHDWPELFRYTKIGITVPYLAPGSHELHQAIEKSLNTLPNTDIIVLDRHGILTTGEDLEECKEHIQRLEHVSEMTLKMLMVSDGIEMLS